MVIPPHKQCTLASLQLHLRVFCLDLFPGLTWTRLAPATCHLCLNLASALSGIRTNPAALHCVCVLRLFRLCSYVDYILDVPMYFVYRDQKYINVAGHSFRDFFNARAPSTLTFFLVCLADTFCPFRASQLLCPGILHWSTLKTTSQPPFQRYFESHPYISPKTDFKLQPLTAGALEAFSGDERRRLRAGKHGLCAASSLGACSRLSASCCEMHHAEIYGHVPQVGLLYDKIALAEATALVSDWTTEERAFLRAQVREPLPIYLDLASVFDGFPLPSTGSKACP